MIVSSTMIAEFITCFEASNHGIWLRNFITGLRIVDTIDIPLNYIVIIVQQYYILTATGTRRNTNISTLSSLL
jgi:hypothetical protein